MTSAVRTDVTAPAVTEIFKELRAMAQQPIPEPNCRRRRSSSSARCRRGSRRQRNAAASYAIPYIYDLGLDYWSGYPKEIATVNAATAQAAAKKYLQADRMIAVAVGDRAKIQPELEKLNLGTIQIRNADADVVTAGAAGEPAKAVR